MKILVVSITYRTLNNIYPAISDLISRGAECQVIWAPTSQKIEDQSPANFGLHVGQDFSGIMADKEGKKIFLENCRSYLLNFQPDLILSDDMTNWPNKIIYSLVRDLPNRPFHLSWQHGLYQPWYAMRKAFDADFFLCYGRVHKFLMGEALAARVLSTGLPKLDSLANRPTSEGGFISWFAQPQPAGPEQVNLVSEIAKATGRPVRIRPHPAAPEAFAAIADLEERNLQLEDPTTDPIESLSHCDELLTTHSSTALEAILLGKPTILFPSFGLTSFPGYPCIASDFTAKSYLTAIRRHKIHSDAIEAFLDDFIGGRRFDHTARTVRFIETLMGFRKRGISLSSLHDNDGPFARELDAASA